MSLEIDEGVRVLLTVLKKVHLQKGSGRQKAALFRGLDQRFRALVDPIIEICLQEGLCYEFKRRGIDIVAPNPVYKKRVMNILHQMQSSTDPAVISCKNV